MVPQYLETRPKPSKTLEVTGMGITSCLGNTLDDVADNLKNGPSEHHISVEHNGAIGNKKGVR